MVPDRNVLILLLASVTFGVSACKTPPEPEVAQTPAFGEPASTIPWNQPQRWEGGAGGLGAMRGNEEN